MYPQKEILAYLLAGGRLTVNKALALFHTTELRVVISRLRKRGYDIRSDRKSDITSSGRKVMFHEYYLVCD